MIVPDTFRVQLAASCVTSVTEKMKKTRNIGRYRKFAKRKNWVVVAKIVASFVARMAKNYASYLLQTSKNSQHQIDILTPGVMPFYVAFISVNE